MARLRTAFARLSASPDRTALLVVVLVASLLRLGFLFRAPPLYVGGDSPTYLQPAVELVQGASFDPIVKRPPGYPLFLAGAIAAFGWDLQGVNLAQHILGIFSAALAWGLGRLTFGRMSGLLAGLLTALNGPLLIYEHYIMAETLFTFLLTAAVLATVCAARRLGTGRLLLAGLLFGLASATRQSAQVLVLLVPLALLLGGSGARAALRGSAWALLGFALVVVPWLAFDYSRHQVLSSGTLGETLVWRLTRSGPDAEFFKWRLAPVADSKLHEARKFALGQAADKILPSDTKVALQQRHGLSESQADALLRSLALEAIAQQPARYLSTSLAILIEHLLGTEQWLGGQGKEGGVTRWPDAVSKYGTWWSAETRPLIQNANPAQEREFRAARALGNLFQPFRYGPALLALFGLGVLAAAFAPAYRLALVPALAALAALVLASFLAGDLPRYRYPADPLLAAVEAGGLVSLIALARRLLMLHRGTASRHPAPALGDPAPGRAAG